MFKLAKILSSGSNVPEPCRLRAISSMEYCCGGALVLNDGELFNADAGQMPMFISAENVGPDESKETLICYPITSDMIFEVPVIGNPSSLYVGAKVKLAEVNGFTSAVSDVTSGGVATVFSTNGAKKSGDRIYVRFN